MNNRKPTNLASIVLRLYRDNSGLFLRIILPVAIIAIIIDIALSFRFNTILDEDIQTGQKITTYLNTINGISPGISIPDSIRINGEDAAYSNTQDSVSWQLFPLPYVSYTNNNGLIWKWTPRFRVIYHAQNIILLLTFCPITLIVAKHLSPSRLPNSLSESKPISAQEAWGQTLKKVFTVLLASVLFLLIPDVGNLLYAAIVNWMPSIASHLPMSLMIFLMMSIRIYLLVTFSLYNPCLILENKSIFGIFRRSHALVSGVLFRYLGVYLFTAWIVSILTSILLGSILLLFSMFFSDLLPIREALTPLRFLTLFVGGNVEIILPNVASAVSTVFIIVIRGMIAALLVPVWVIVTTQLYLERTDMKPEIIQEA